MHLSTRALTLLLLALALATVPRPAFAQNEPGSVRISGTGTYEAADTPDEIPAPVIAAVNLGPALVNHNALYTASPGGVVFGRITSEFDHPPFSYELSLPADPGDPWVQVAPHVDGRWVQIGSVNVFNDNDRRPSAPMLDSIEQSSQVFLSSLDRRLPDTSDAIFEPIGGTLVIHATAAGTLFPSSPGSDRRLFTADDPLTELPAGWTLVHLDGSGFSFDHSAVLTMPIIESAYRTNPDLSTLSYVESFERFIDLMTERYAYTDLRQIEWAAIRAGMLPRIQASADSASPAEFDLVFADIAARLRDGHVVLIPANPESARAIGARSRSRSIGLDPPSTASNWPDSLIRTDDDKILVMQVTPGSEAERAGIRPGTELVSVNDQAASLWLGKIAGESSFASQARRGIEGLKLSLRQGETISLKFQSPDEPPRDQVFSAADAPSFARPPVESEPGALPTRDVSDLETRLIGRPDQRPLVYLHWTRFVRDPVILEGLSTALERWTSARGMIIDMRGNGGGSDHLMASILSRFFDPEQPLIADAFVSRRYDPSSAVWVTTGPFQRPSHLPIAAPSESRHFPGAVSVLTDARCASMCEFFSAWMKQSQRATIISADDSTSGAGGSVYRLKLPTGATFTYTYSQELWAETGEPYVEQVGVTPDVRVPIDDAFVQALLEGRDPVLDFAVEQMRQ